MCQGMKFCGDCDVHAREHGVHDWAEGLVHERPKFGDYNQLRAAEAQRRLAFQRAVETAPLLAMKFPEFVHAGEPAKYINFFIGRMRANFDRIVAGIPAFAAFVEAHPRKKADCGLSGWRRRKSRTRSRNYWREGIIVRYINEVGVSAVAEIHALCGWDMPWWASAKPTAFVEQLKAA